MFWKANSFLAEKETKASGTSGICPEGHLGLQSPESRQTQGRLSGDEPTWLADLSLGNRHPRPQGSCVPFSAPSEGGRVGLR